MTSLRQKSTEQWLKEWRETHGLGQTSTDISYKHALLQAGDEWLQKGQTNPRTTRSAAEERRRQKINQRILSRQQRRRQKLQEEAAKARERFGAEMAVYESMQPKPKEPKS
jgi:hypothetical protein